MKPDRWREIERLYHAARDRKPDEIAAFLDESCGGDNSLRREVESLLAHRLRAEKFIESPALQAAGGILAKNQPSQSAAGGEQRIQEFTGEAGQRPSRRGRLPPLWIFLISMPFVTCAGFLYFWLFFGPVPVGWVVQLADQAGIEGWNRITNIRRQSPAARSGFQ